MLSGRRLHVPFRHAKGDSDEFQEFTWGPLTQVHDSTTPNSMFPPTRPQPSQTQLLYKRVFLKTQTPKARLGEAGRVSPNRTRGTASAFAKYGDPAAEGFFCSRTRSHCVCKRCGSTAGPQPRHAHHPRLRRISKRRCSDQSLLRACSCPTPTLYMGCNHSTSL